MSPILNLPAGFAQHTMVWGGTALPTGAVSTFCTKVPAGVTNPATAASSVLGITEGASGWWLVGNAWPLTVTLVKLVTKFGPIATGPFGEASSGRAGGASGDSYSPNSAILVAKNTNLGGRRARGRMYLPPWTENGIGPAGALDSAIVAANNTRFGTWHSALIAAGYDPVLCHRYDPALGESPTAPTDIQNWTMQLQLASQRRRLRR